MKVVIGIPTGWRIEKVVRVVAAWQKIGIPAVVYTWDEDTHLVLGDKVEMIIKGELQSFAKNQNLLTRTFQGWDVFICGADDLYPSRNCDKIGEFAAKYPGKIFWFADGFLNAQPTHPVITREWFERHNRVIFDENFKHNFTDTDLYIRAREAGELVKCMDISFNHLHRLKTRERPDKIHRIGDETYAEDEVYFNQKWSAIETPRTVQEVFV